ncbi:hypothetical protein QAD02_020931 [Eretmocerus hayati]|uniref:Uncharacterized protein n=1 Tax=Eretmocerus hayati TaxID=131215 RepID=A0ACC2PQ50_9HYME|nr:hypothetical protein QAD02_020931 [Eretmocerus hayati]
MRASIAGLDTAPERLIRGAVQASIPGILDVYYCPTHGILPLLVTGLADDTNGAHVSSGRISNLTTTGLNESQCGIDTKLDQIIALDINASGCVFLNVCSVKWPI